MRLFFQLLFISIVVVFALIVGLRLFSGEDNWICSEGQWVKHGSPIAPMPQEECPAE